MIEPLLLTSTPVATFSSQTKLSNGSGFFFRRQDRLYLVTSRHVLFDEPSQHNPDRIEITFHTDIDNLAEAVGFSVPLFDGGHKVWKEVDDSDGLVDVAALQLDSHRLPETAVYEAFGPEHLVTAGVEQPRIGSALLIVGFPLGFYDQLHHMPVARQAAIASSYGWRFEGKGYFLTDARMHRGSSGAPVVMPMAVQGHALGTLAWRLLGIHSARLDVGGRDLQEDEALGLNCAWYADVLMSLTDID